MTAGPPASSFSGRWQACPAGPRPTVALGLVGGGEASVPRVGRPVSLLHFFATWCEPCRAELAALDGLARGRPDIAVELVDVGEPASRVARFLAENAIGLPVALDRERAAMRAWDVTGLPTTFVLDREGATRLRVTGAIDWASPDVQPRLAELADRREPAALTDIEPCGD